MKAGIWTRGCLLTGALVLALGLEEHGEPASLELDEAGIGLFGAVTFFGAMFGGLFLLSTVGMMAGGMGGRGGGQKKAEMNEDRKDYLRYLGQMRDRAREAEEDTSVASDDRARRLETDDDAVQVWTVHRSKGLERYAVILVTEDENLDDDLLYVGMSRSVMRLAVIGPPNLIKRLRNLSRWAPGTDPREAGD